MRGGVMRIGITGGIGSGKSTVTGHIIDRGYQVLDADKIARQIVLPGEPALARLIEAFGPGILGKDGALDRKKLAALTFGDPESVKLMNDIMHGEIYDIMMDGLLHPESDPVFADVPLLFETGFEKDLDKVWLVTAPVEIRIKRVEQRDGEPRDHIVARMKSQMPEEERMKKADVIIENDRPLEELYSIVDALLEETHENNRK